MKKFSIITFGCQMNKHDSEKIAGILQDSGFQYEKDPSNADIIIFNTCTVRESADGRLFGQLGNIKRLKEEKPGLIVAIGGCLAQSYGRELLFQFPQLDIVFGTHNINRFLYLLNERIKSGNKVFELKSEDNYDISCLPTLREKPFLAWVSIMRGCDNFCSYCIVPYVRGRQWSRPSYEIIEEVKNLVSDGVIEITLLGQNVNSYGKDLNDEMNFPQLLEKLSQISELKRIRFTTSHPKDFDSETVKVVAKSEILCNHFHLPLQSGSNKVLQDMNRRYTKEQYLKLIDEIYRVIPDASVTTDIIVGFPTETEEDFLETLDVVNRAKFDSAFTFIYSPRLGTKAIRFKDIFSNEEKMDRFNRLVNKQTNISQMKNNCLIGRNLDILVEDFSKKDKKMLMGRTKTNKIVNFIGDSSLIGRIVNVKIILAKAYYLIGELKNN
jgi:tRNA-2-methylthio-N6-dimethylallyladenosine synthase